MMATEFATKQDLDALRVRIDARFDKLEARLDGRIDNVEGTLVGGLGTLGGRIDKLEGTIEGGLGRLDGKIAEFRGEVDRRFARQTWTLVFTSIGSMLGFGTIVLAAAGIS